MSLDALNDEVERLGGSWVKLRTTEDPAIEGEIVAFEKRPKTFEGQPVLSRKTGEQRVEWVFTLRVDELDGAEDDGLRLISLNESGQRAVAKAIKDAGRKAEIGGRLKVGVKTNPANDREQAEYQARYTPPAQAIDTSGF